MTNLTTPADVTSGRSTTRLVHLELLLSLVALLVIQSFLSSTTLLQRILFNVLLFVVVLSAIRSLSASRSRLLLALALGVLGFFGALIADPLSSVAMLSVVDVCYGAVFVLLLVALCESVFADGDVDADRIIGAICIFFVIGLLWALIYTLLEIFQPGSFSITAVQAPGIQQETLGQLMYFSYVTLTTLGYGDVVPVTDASRMLATIEAMIGQLYIAIVIARLVGLHISQSR